MPRTGSWSGSNGNAWPALSNGNTWDAVAAAAASTVYYSNVASTVNGSGSGLLTVGYNAEPTEPAQALSGSYATSTDANTFLWPTVSTVPTAGYLFGFATTATAQHYHQIDFFGSTGAWLTATGTKVMDYGYFTGTVYVRMTLWTVGPFYNSDTGQLRLRIKDTAGITVGQNFNYFASGTIGNNVTATNSQYFAISLAGYKTTNNYYDAVVNTNTTSASGTGTSVTLTLPNDLSAYNNRMVGWFVHNVNETTSGTQAAGGGGIGSITNTNLGTPPLAALSQFAKYSTGDLTVRKNKTMGAQWNTSSTYGAIAVELADVLRDSKDSYSATSSAGAVDVYRTIGGTTYTNAEVYSSYPTSGAAGPLGRVVTVSGIKYGITASYTATYNSIKGNTDRTLAVLIVNLNDGTTSVLGSTSSTSAAMTGDTMAIRVRNSPTGSGLWVSAKYFTRSGTEPDWPTSSSDASSFANQVVNAVDNGALATSIAAAGAGKSGVAYSALYGPATTDVNFSAAVSYYSDDVIAYSSTSTISSSGGLAATGQNIIVGTVPATGSGAASGSMTISAIVVASPDASASGSGDVLADGVTIVQSSATASGAGEIVAVDGASYTGTATATGTGTLTASGIEIVDEVIILSGESTIATTGYSTILETVTLSGLSTVTTTESLTLLSSATLDGTSTVTTTETFIALDDSTIFGTGALEADVSATLVSEATLDASGGIVCNAVGIAPNGAAMSGISSGTVEVAIDVFAAGSADGAGELTGDGLRIVEADATLSGSSSGQMTGGLLVVDEATCSGTSQLSADPIIRFFVEATLEASSAGSSSLTAIAISTGSSTAIGGMVVDGKWVHYIPNTLRMTSTRKIAPTSWHTQGVTETGTPIPMGLVQTRKVGTGTFTTEAQE